MSGTTTAPFPFTQSTFMQGIAVASNTVNEINSALTTPLFIPAFAVSSLPPASEYSGCLIKVLQGTANVATTLALSDGVNWRWVLTGAIVS